MNRADMITQRENFLYDVEHHILKVIRDDRLFRVLKCAQEGPIANAFEVVTWPHNLCLVGENGTMHFNGLRDFMPLFQIEYDDRVDTDKPLRNMVIKPEEWQRYITTSSHSFESVQANWNLFAVMFVAYHVDIQRKAKLLDEATPREKDIPAFQALKRDLP